MEDQDEKELIVRKHPGGRPPKLIPDERTIAAIRKLASCQMSQEMAAGILGVTRETFRQFLGRHIEARNAWKRGRDAGKGGLLVTQFTLAKRSPAMAIWLGKTILGQKGPEHSAGRRFDPLLEVARQEEAARQEKAKKGK